MPEVLGVVPVLGREPLASRHLGDASLVDRAVAAVYSVTPDVLVVTDTDSEQVVRDRLRAAAVVVIHDPLCPLVPAHFLRTMAEPAARMPRVGVRPVVDTVKATDEGAVVRTVDREVLRVVCSPLVASGKHLAAVPLLWSGLGDLALLVTALRETTDVELVAAPSASRRIEDVSGLELTASIDAVGHRTRER